MGWFVFGALPECGGTLEDVKFNVFNKSSTQCDMKTDQLVNTSENRGSTEVIYIVLRSMESIAHCAFLPTVSLCVKSSNL